MSRSGKKRKVCPICKKGKLKEEYEDCMFCGGGTVLCCDNPECGAMFDEKLKQIA